MLGWNRIIRSTQIVGVCVIALAAQSASHEARAQQLISGSAAIGLPDPDQPVETVTERYPKGQEKIRRETTLDTEGNYIHHGRWTMFSERGDVIAEGTYRNNLRHGNWMRVYAANDAPLFSTSPYAEFEAPFTSQATFEDGQLHGKWVIFDAKQRIVSEWDYDKGIRHGMALWYYPSGKIQQQVAYNKGLLDGMLKHYDLNANLIAEDTYQLGQKLAEKVERDNADHVVSKGMFLHAQRVVDKADDWWNAQPVTYTVKGTDIHHGDWTAWYPNGHKKAEGVYDHDRRNGAFKWWYENSQPRVSAEFKDDKPAGMWTWWHSNGQKAAEGQYAEGVQTGAWSHWNENGRLNQKADYGTAGAVADRQQDGAALFTSQSIDPITED